MEAYLGTLLRNWIVFTYSLHLEKSSLELEEGKDLALLKTLSCHNLCEGSFSIAMVMFICSLFYMWNYLAYFSMFVL